MSLMSIFARPASKRLWLVLGAMTLTIAAFGLESLLNGAVEAGNNEQQATAKTLPPGTQIATFAGGCFWCVESDFDSVPGVLKTVSGYTGGKAANPTYKQVVAGGTGHREAVQIYFDPGRVSYAQLVEIFWRTVDPTDAGGQFCDRGHSYSTAIYTHNKSQAAAAAASKRALEQSGVLSASIVTPIEQASAFYAAEKYHQNYYEKNPLRYSFYRSGCGRDRRIKSVWGEQAHRGTKN